MAEAGQPSDPKRGRGLAIAALVVTALGACFLSGVYPLEAHADDWPGPGVGAAISLELSLIPSFVGVLLALGTWRPPQPTQLAWAALISSAAVFALVGVTFLTVGLGPFCGRDEGALAGVPHEPRSALEVLSTPCGAFILGQYLVPLLIGAAFFYWRMKRAAPMPSVRL